MSCRFCGATRQAIRRLVSKTTGSRVESALRILVKRSRQESRKARVKYPSEWDKFDRYK